MLCVPNLLHDFRGFCGFLLHLSCLHVDDLFNDSHQDSFNWKCCVQLHDLHDHVIGNSFVNNKAGLLQQFPLDSARASEFALAVHPQSSRPGQHNSVRNSLCETTLTLCWVCQRSVSLRIVNVVLFDLVLRFFIRELLTHTFLHVALNLLHSVAAAFNCSIGAF